jgi:hypothetical protein
MAAGTGSAYQAAAGNTLFGVYNNANDGSWLAIWDVQASLIGDTGNTGVHNINLLISATVNPTNAGSAAVVYSPILDEAAAVAGEFFGASPYNSVYWGDGFYNPQLPTTGFWAWQHEYPLCYVRPGHSFVVAGDSSYPAFYGFNIMWEAVRRL